ncbi:MAG: serine hydroxymethyltransferase [Candidatus Woesearchaeota archaeon]
MKIKKLRKVDPESAKWLDKELKREVMTIELIASENFVYESILEAQGSILTNKYAEGYPGKRYHGGCRYIDEIESLAIERAKKLFKADHANVQPHSGVNANLAVYMALIKPGATILGMNLKHGGHLSHGSKVSITGQYYNSYTYGVKEDTGLIDYEQVENLALKHKPELIIAGASAYSRQIDFNKFREIADKIDAYFLVDMAHIAGLVAADLHPNPAEYADIVTSTTTKTMRGARGGMILCKEEFKKAVDKAIFPGTQGGPILQNVLAKAVTFKVALEDEFKDYQKQIIKNAKTLAKKLKDNGLEIVSGGTDNHLMLVDLRPWNLTGREAEEALKEVGITVNMNLIPHDPKPATVTSGIRIGTPAVTSRGFIEEDMKKLGDIIISVLKETQKGEISKSHRKEVEKLCKKNPLYLDRLEIGSQYLGY